MEKSVDNLLMNGKITFLKYLPLFTRRRGRLSNPSVPPLCSASKSRVPSSSLSLSRQIGSRVWRHPAAANSWCCPFWVKMPQK